MPLKTNAKCTEPSKNSLCESFHESTSQKLSLKNLIAHYKRTWLQCCQCRESLHNPLVNETMKNLMKFKQNSYLHLQYTHTHSKFTANTFMFQISMIVKSARHMDNFSSFSETPTGNPLYSTIEWISTLTLYAHALSHLY